MATQTPALNQAADDLKSNAKIAATMLKAIANESRLLILCNLDGTELSVTELNDHLDLSQSALSQHLAVLRKDGLVKTRRESQTIYYSLSDVRASKVINTLHELYCS
ncbi:MAG: winged helix-turn-helix transcriptional regulator [Oceanospirillaceae bacterium]|jgi:DNA-binding transcriptional ArsR family regulator|nr:winged helix-turn-helix transcriptional regulator [Oceanospirillaceae bacterium]MBT4442332.1 winged helix-turn-helix transcriptional regulator [Oceanospirillaceae bacterium]MBT6076385.1 winged helix-turn-helix transcriptional regulator [Oceanospirillaceae bacterium]